MPDTKISALTAGDPAQGTDEIPIARAGSNFKVTAASIAALSPSGTVTSVGLSGGTTGITITGTNPITGSGTFTLGGTLVAANGGTGQSSYAVGDLLYASTTTALSKLADVATGNALISGGVGVAPSWGKIGLTTHVSGTLPTANGGTNLTSFTSGGAMYATSTSALTTGTLPSTAGGTGLTSFTSGGAVYATSTSALTTGTLPATAGGTGQSSYAVGDLVYASTTTALSKLADVATGNALISGGVGVAPSYGKIGLTTHVSGTLPIANGGTGQTSASAAFNALSPVTTTGDLIIGNGTNSSTRLAIGTNGYVLTSNGTTASWQAAGGGGGGVTSFSAGTTGFNPSSATTGAITLSGTLNISNGGTGTSSNPTNGQLLIGNGGGGYSVANLTAGSGISITNSSGSITIAATGGAVTINDITITTTLGTFGNPAPGASVSRPLVGYTVSGSNYGALFFETATGPNNVSSPSLSSIDITDTASNMTSYLSGADFTSSPTNFNVHGYTLSCYGLAIYNTTMQGLFSASASAITSPSFAPIDASNGFASNNPQITVTTSGSLYDNGFYRGIVVSKPGGLFYLQFDTNDFTPATVTVSAIAVTINGSAQSYFSGSDFTSTSGTNSSSGEFIMDITPISGSLVTLLNNSFL